MLPSLALILSWALQPCLAASPNHISEASCPSTTLLEPRVCGLYNDNPSTRTECPLSDDVNIIKAVEPRWIGPTDCVHNFCIYSNPSYAGGRGLVIITKSWYTESIQKIMDVPYGDEPDAEMYRVEEITGKGVGLVATRRLERGEELMRVAPIFMVHMDVLRRAAGGPGFLLDLLEMGFERLPQAARDLLMRETRRAAGRSKIHRLVEMLGTNSYDVGLEGITGKGPHVALYPGLSRINHDCRPNLAYRTDSSLLHRNRVARTVLPGQELTVSYVDPFLSTRDRLSQTRRNWSFDCRCSRCALPPLLAFEADQRLRRIRQLELDLSSWDSHATINDVREMVRLYEEERLDIKLALPLFMAAENANALGYDDEARAYAARAIEAGLLEMEMTEGGSLMTMKAILEDPKGHYSYRKRIWVQEANELERERWRRLGRGG